jgi:hypothetical protein
VAIEQVSYIGLKETVDPFGDRDQLADSKVLVEIVWTADLRIVLRLVTEQKVIHGIGISPGGGIEILNVGVR